MESYDTMHLDPLEQATLRAPSHAVVVKQLPCCSGGRLNHSAPPLLVATKPPVWVTPMQLSDEPQEILLRGGVSNATGVNVTPSMDCSIPDEPPMKHVAAAQATALS
jgi:hypothetical protein